MEDCQVTEEVIQESWNDCPELVVAEEHIVGTDEQATNDDIEIPLPTDQDQYTAARPYPCDFCSRRFRYPFFLLISDFCHSLLVFSFLGKRQIC